MYARALGDQDATRALAEGRTWQPPQATRVELIPRILHRTVPTETTAQVETWWARFGELHPDWELRTYRDPLDPAEWPLTAHAWDSCTSGAQRAGLIRLEALYRFGGIYVDSDCEPFQSLEPLLACHAFAAWEDELVIPDAVLGAEPEHPVIRTAISLAIARIGQGAWASGPGVTTELFTGRPDILLLPPGSFYDVHYRDPRRQRKMQQEPSPWTFLRHHYAGSWLEDVA
jgi:mannosyltransferase OCH1-like enzyme